MTDETTDKPKPKLTLSLGAGKAGAAPAPRRAKRPCRRRWRWRRAATGSAGRRPRFAPADRKDEAGRLRPARRYRPADGLSRHGPR